MGRDVEVPTTLPLVPGQHGTDSCQFHVDIRPEPYFGAGPGRTVSVHPTVYSTALSEDLDRAYQHEEGIRRATDLLACPSCLLEKPSA